MIIEGHCKCKDLNELKKTLTVVYKLGGKVVSESFGKIISKGISEVEDSKIIKSAVNAGGKIYVGPGIYHIDRTIVVK